MDRIKKSIEQIRGVHTFQHNEAGTNIQVSSVPMFGKPISSQPVICDWDETFVS